MHALALVSLSDTDILLMQDFICGTAETSLFEHSKAISSQSIGYRVGQSMRLRFSSLQLGS